MKNVLDKVRNQLPKRMGRNTAKDPAEKKRAKELKPRTYAPPAIIGLLIGIVLRLLFEAVK